MKDILIRFFAVCNVVIIAVVFIVKITLNAFFSHVNCFGCLRLLDMICVRNKRRRRLIGIALK